jgi:formate-dependent nitrite reductase membrane component NrfD
MDHNEWGLLIVNYLFLGGISAGCFFASALAAFLQGGDRESYQRIARYGAWIAPWPVSLGSLLLIFDLGNWVRFYKLFLHFRWQSPMSIGSWLLMLFSAIALLYCWSWLPGDVRRRLLAALRAPHWLDRDLSRFRLPLAAAGLPLAVGVGIYTGVLLGAVQSRPFWNTNLVAQMFLFSALSTGCAVLIAALSLSSEGLDSHQARFLYTLDVCLAGLELFIVLPYLVHGELSVQAVRESLELILGGPYTFAFWFLFMGIGLLLPLALEVRELVPALLRGAPLHSNRWIAALTAILVVFGGYALRYVFVYAGQASRFR